ncbi:hypothetical protein TRVA0_048S00188 [Trichomonascus vanleenenianus]|uniref:uncharacterized protein n=1 Tax=Trichomonascus vanleenenianus TaxID=2268995 RepID=UPI003ECA16CF
MVSKLFAASLALAVVGSLGQIPSCTLSTPGGWIENDAGSLITDSSAFQQALSNWDGGLDSAIQIANQEYNVYMDVRSVYQDLFNPGVNDCDYQTFLGQLAEAAPTLTSALQALADEASALIPVNGVTIEQWLNNLASMYALLIGQLPVWLPSNYVDQALDTMDPVTNALNAAVAAFNPTTTTTLPSIPTSNPTSTLASVPTSTPTSPPPVCRKKQQPSLQES